MELAKITSKGQITLPINIRRKLGVNNGDKVLFIEEAGRIYIVNPLIELSSNHQERDLFGSTSIDK